MIVLLYGRPDVPRETVEDALGRLRRKHPRMRLVSPFRLGSEQLAGIWAMGHSVPIEHRPVEVEPRGDAAVSFGDHDNAARACRAGLPVWEVCP